MTLRAEDGEIQREYVLRRIRHGDVMNSYIGSYANRKTIDVENVALYGRSQIEVNENNRTSMAEMHDQNGPNRGIYETWYNPLSTMIRPMGGDIDTSSQQEGRRRAPPCPGAHRRTRSAQGYAGGCIR